MVLESSCTMLSSSWVFCPRTGPSLQAQEPRLQFCRRQVFHHELRNQGSSFTRDLIGAVASRCFPHPTLSLATEQTLKGLKNPRGTNEEVRRVNLANWALRTSLKFTTRVKHQFHQGFNLKIVILAMFVLDHGCANHGTVWETLQSPIHCYDVTNPPYLFSGELCTSPLHCKRLFVYTVCCRRAVSASLSSDHVNQTSYLRSGR